MDRFSRFFCDPVKVVKFIAATAISVGVLVYAYLQAMGGFNNEIVTDTSFLVSMNRSVSADAYVFRDETVVNASSNDGTIVTLVSDGDRVSKGQMIANVYPDAGDASLQDDINRVQRRLDILEDSALDSEFIISDLAELDKDIDEVFADIYADASHGGLSSVIDKSSELLVLMNKRDLIVDSDFDYSKEQANLLDEKQKLQEHIRSISTPIYASDSGYFYGETDGYESVFDISEVKKITLDSFKNFAESQMNESEKSSVGVKIVNDFVWYMVCSLNSEDLAGINEGYSYTLSFPENADCEIKMMLERIVKETNSPTALAVFRVNVLPDDFDYKRSQKAEIVLSKTEGLSVPKKALRVVNGVEGVYILVGDVVRFRQIERLAEKDEYYIVKHFTGSELFEAENKTDSNLKMLSLYDNVIVSGKDLFDGKIIG